MSRCDGKTILCVHCLRASSNYMTLAGINILIGSKPYYRDDISWLVVQSACQLFVVGDEVCYVDFAEVLLDQDVFSDLITLLGQHLFNLA